MQITLHQTSLNDLQLFNSEINVFDLLGRKIEEVEKGFYFRVFENGLIQKFYQLD